MTRYKLPEVNQENAERLATVAQSIDHDAGLSTPWPIYQERALKILRTLHIAFGDVSDTVMKVQWGDNDTNSD